MNFEKYAKTQKLDSNKAGEVLLTFASGVANNGNLSFILEQIDVKPEDSKETVTNKIAALNTPNEQRERIRQLLASDENEHSNPTLDEGVNSTNIELLDEVAKDLSRFAEDKDSVIYPDDEKLQEEINTLLEFLQS